MEKDTELTEVQFYTYITNKDTYAFFPKEKYNNIDDKLYVSYSVVGQHSACNIDYVKESVPASKEKRVDLIKDLLSVGYNLKITN